jgi:sugar O-acyltransferase (sialic acid O-acetyltransferase NeuD family)
MPSREQIVLIGGGGHCKACIDVIEAEDRFAIAGIVDVKDKMGQEVLGYKIIASDENFPELAKKFKYFLITIGQTNSPLLRIEKFDLIQNLNAMLPTVTSPSAYVSRHAKVKEGTIVMHMAVVNADARIAKNCIINTGAIIEHDCLIEDHVHISPNAVLSGGVSVSTGTFIGTGATVMQGIKIGKDAIVGAGAVVINDVEDNRIVKGVPAK